MTKLSRSVEIASLNDDLNGTKGFQGVAKTMNVHLILDDDWERPALAVIIKTNGRSRAVRSPREALDEIHEATGPVTYTLYTDSKTLNISADLGELYLLIEEMLGAAY